MPKQPLVSIIIPTYNRVHLIGETLDSVLAQTYTNWECIVVDDGSSDHTAELLKTYCDTDARFKYVQRPDTHKPGGNGARNYGFELSKGEYIQWFDSDDVMHSEKIQLQVSKLIGSTLNFCVCQNLVFENINDKNLPLRHPLIYSEKPFNDYLKGNIVWMTPSAIWKKSFLKNFKNLFDEDLRAAQEWEFLCRVLAKEDNYIVCDKPLVYMRKHNNSITYNSNESFRKWNYYIARLKIYKNKSIVLDKDAAVYLRCYLLKKFKDFVLANEFLYGTKAYFYFLVKESKLNFRSKAIALVFLFTMGIFNRGYKLSKKITC